MNIVIRVDASLQIGSGHVMRCLTLAKFLRHQGHQIIFVCREFDGHLLDFIAQKDFEIKRLIKPKSSTLVKQYTHSDWLGVSENEDFDECQPILVSLQPDWLIVDHYAIGAGWERKAKQCLTNVKILVIDDLADREHYCDILLDQNIAIEGKSDYKNLVPSNCQLLLGSKYCLLREEFNQSFKKKSVSNKIFAYFGGTDPKEYSQDFIKSFYRQNLQKNYNLELVTSKQNKDLHTIINLSNKYGFDCIIDDDNIAKRMGRSKFAVIACGFACYELAALQIPAIYFASSDIQKKVAMALTKVGAGILATNNVNADFKKLFSELENINPIGFDDFDANGVARVAKFLKE